MIVLYGGGPGFGLPEVSPYVTKAEVQLKMSGLPFRKEFGLPRDSPKGQVPFIDDDGQRIGDSTFIRDHIERKYGVDLDAGLSEEARAQAWAIERMVENHYVWTNSHARWIIPANFEKGPARWFDAAPAADRARLRAEAQADVAAKLRAVGIGRHSHAEIVALAARSLAALSALLGAKPFLMGAAPTGTDAIAFAGLAGALTPFFESPQRREAEKFPTLVAYAARMMTRFYPAHPWPAA